MSGAHGRRRRREISLAPRHPFSVERQALAGVRARDQEAMVLHEDDRGRGTVLLPVSLRSRLDRRCQAPTRVGIGHPERRQFAGRADFRQGRSAWPAVQGIGRHGVRVDHHATEHGVQRSLDRWAPAATDSRGVQALEDVRLALFHRERGEIGSVEDVQHCRHVHFHPTVRFAHQGQGGAAGLDGHGAAVGRLDGRVAAGRLHVLPIGSHHMGDLDQLRQGILVHYSRRYSQSITVLMPCPASITAKALTMSSNLNLCVTNRSQGMSSRPIISSA